MRCQVFGKDLLFVHYHLKDDYFIQIDKDPSTENLDKLYGKSNLDLVCFGHHHIVHDFKSKNRQYLNPGSLGCCHKPLARYGIVEITEDGINHQFSAVPYDNKSFLKSYELLKVPEREFILKVFHGVNKNLWV